MGISALHPFIQWPGETLIRDGEGGRKEEVRGLEWSNQVWV